MGLKTINYTIKGQGITVPTAYARISYLNIDVRGRCNATFIIQQTREDTVKLLPLEKISFTTNIDKEQPLYEQVYIQAKEVLFKGWEDDIVKVV